MRFLLSSSAGDVQPLTDAMGTDGGRAGSAPSVSPPVSPPVLSGPAPF